eukprot:765644-Hanusia_phi.AAC.1
MHCLYTTFFIRRVRPSCTYRDSWGCPFLSMRRRAAELPRRKCLHSIAEVMPATAGLNVCP